MFKKIFFIIFFLNFLQNFAFGNIIDQCEGNLNKNTFSDIFEQRPKLIEIKINKYRKWQKNNLKIHLSKSDILQKYKKKFNSKVIVNYNNDIKCKFKAKVRQSGDHTDHIKFENGNFIQSVDVELKNGNINGITKFKLLIPETRGAGSPNVVNYEDEILVTEIFRNLGFISPRTFMMDVKINGNPFLMMFQEKTEKEMLEFHDRKEGPILEGDEKYKFTWLQENQDILNLKDIVDKKKITRNISKLDGGLAKQTNVNWSIKSTNHLDISEKALTKLNKIYLKYIDQFKYNFIYNYSHFHLDNHLLANENQNQIIEWDVFTAISLSISRGHGLRPHNRKFYWDSTNEFFEPIYYDGNVMLDWVLPHMQIPFNTISDESINISKNRIKNLNIEKLFQTINQSGSTYSKNLIEKKINNILKNLDNLKNKKNKNQNKDYIVLKIPKNFDFTKDYFNLNSEEISFLKNLNEHRIYLYKRGKNLSKEAWKNYIKLHFDIVPNLKLVLKNEKKQTYHECTNNDLNLDCNEIKFDNKQLKKLLSGKLTSNNISYQYIGKFENQDILKINNTENYKKINIQKSNFFFEKNIEYDFDEDKNRIDIYQKEPGSRAFFINGTLEDIEIYFHGYNGIITSDLPKYPFDIKGLTGCLSFINLKFKNAKIDSTNSTCEDSVNLVNVDGFLEKININNSYSDGLDMDFSRVKINNINVENSKNDCVDVSYGNYELDKLNLTGCGDKSLSVGESSILKLNLMNSKNSKIGIASKDSSKTFVNLIKIKNVSTCLAAYNKKQEFLGGFIEAEKMQCVNFVKKIDEDKQSIIYFKNEL